MAVAHKARAAIVADKTVAAARVATEVAKDVAVDAADKTAAVAQKAHAANKFS